MSTALIPFHEVQGMAEAIARSGLFGMKTPDQAIALMLVAQAEGQHPATITQEYDIIQGRAARKTHSVLARFQAAGGTVQWHELSEAVADATFAHKSGGQLRMTWTFDQAKKAGLTNKDNWKNYPRAMLRARCIAEGVRAVYPAALGGMLVAEEAMDYPQDMGPAEVVSKWNPDQMSSADEAAAQGAKAYANFWKSLTREVQQKLAGTPEHQRFKDQAQRADVARTVEAPATATAADPQTGEIVPTVSDVRARLEAAKNEDALYVAMDWFNALPEGEQEQHRADIEAVFDGRLKAIRGE